MKHQTDSTKERVSSHTQPSPTADQPSDSSTVALKPKPPNRIDTDEIDTDEQPAADTTSDDESRHLPIPPASEPKQYRAIGLIYGKYVPSEEQFTRGNLITADNIAVDAVLLGRVMSLVKKHIELDKPHLWVVYPRTRTRDRDLHAQIVGVWEPEKLNRFDDESSSDDDVSGAGDMPGAEVSDIEPSPQSLSKRETETTEPTVLKSDIPSPGFGDAASEDPLSVESESATRSQGRKHRALDASTPSISTDVELVDTESVDTESAEAQSTEAQSAETESAETESAETESAETESAEAQSAEAQSAEAQSAEAQSAEAQSAEAQSAEAQSAEAQSAEAERTETGAASSEKENKSTDSTASFSKADASDSESSGTHSSDIKSSDTALSSDTAVDDEGGGEEHDDPDVDHAAPFFTGDHELLKDGYFSIRGEVVKVSEEDHEITVRIRQAPRKGSTQQRSFNLVLKGHLEGRLMGYFWDMNVQREGTDLVIQDGSSVGVVLPKKRDKKKFSGRGKGGPRGRSGPPGKRNWENRSGQGDRPDRPDGPRRQPIAKPQKAKGEKSQPNPKIN